MLTAFCALYQWFDMTQAMWHDEGQSRRHGVAARLGLIVQVCLDDLNSKGNARDPGCVMRNRIAAYLYSKEATEKPIPSVSVLPEPASVFHPLEPWISGAKSLFEVFEGIFCRVSAQQTEKGLMSRAAQMPSCITRMA